MDAVAAWAKGADSNGTRITDLERGWFLTHQDLPLGIQMISGTNLYTGFGHGCATLGVVTAVDNNVGVCVAPHTSARIASAVEQYNPRKPITHREWLADRVMVAQSKTTAMFCSWR